MKDVAENVTTITIVNVSSSPLSAKWRACEQKYGGIANRYQK